MADIVHTIKIDAAPERVFEALTTSEGVRQWWTRDADVSSEVGAACEFRVPNYGPDAATRTRIESIEYPTELCWSVQECIYESWAGTSIIFKLRAADEATILSFRHQGFAEQNEEFGFFNLGWAYYLVSLQQHLETGSSSPNPDIDFARLFLGRAA